MSQTAKFEETSRRLAMIDEGFVGGEIGLKIDSAAASALDPKTAAPAGTAGAGQEHRR